MLFLAHCCFLAMAAAVLAAPGIPVPADLSSITTERPTDKYEELIAKVMREGATREEAERIAALMGVPPPDDMAGVIMEAVLASSQTDGHRGVVCPNETPLCCHIGKYGELRGCKEPVDVSTPAKFHGSCAMGQNLVAVCCRLKMVSLFFFFLFFSLDGLWGVVRWRLIRACRLKKV